jgi:hypothetical protein
MGTGFFGATTEAVVTLVCTRLGFPQRGIDGKDGSGEGAMMPQTSDVAELRVRLKKLERQYRRLKFTGSMVLVLAGASLLTGQALPNRRSVEAEEFVLRDSAGTPRAVLSLKAEGGPTLAFFDPSGKTRAWLGVRGGGSPYLLFADQAGKPRAGLSVKDDGSPDLTFIDLTGNPRALLQVPSDGQASLAFYDHLGRTRAGLGVTRNGSPELSLLDKDGKVVWRAP